MNDYHEPLRVKVKWFFIWTALIMVGIIGSPILLPRAIYRWRRV
jgi:hypothetical protein